MQDEVDKLYQNYDEWTRRSILYTASAGFFSSDRTIHQYAKARPSSAKSDIDMQHFCLRNCAQGCKA